MSNTSRPIPADVMINVWICMKLDLAMTFYLIEWLIALLAKHSALSGPLSLCRTGIYQSRPSPLPKGFVFLVL